MKFQKLLAAFTFIASFALSGLFFLYKDYFRGTESLGLLGIFLINFVSSATFFVSGPAFLTVIAGGALYRPLFVALSASFGSALGDMLGYIFGLSGRELVLSDLHKKKWLQVVHKRFHGYGGWIIFAFAFIPNPFFDSIGILAGVFKYPLWKYAIIVFIGRFIRFYLLAQFGKLF